MKIGKYISKDDAKIMIEIINMNLQCKSKEEYKSIIEECRRVLFFDYAVSGVVDTGSISFKNSVSSSVNIDYPVEFLKIYTNSKHHLIDPLFQEFVKTLDIQNSEEIKNLYKSSPGDVIGRLREDFGITNCYVHGMYNSYFNYFTVFNMSGKNIKNNERTKAIIKYLVPHLSMSIERLFPSSGKEDDLSLTATQLEVLKWLKEGKTSWEVSIILNISERTVNFHVSNILNKLNAVNRTHAVAIALRKGLIGI